MNYGHPLEFGVVITPASSSPDEAVDLARLSETLGYDIIALGNQPAESTPVDLWTLLSWVAARTERARLVVSLRDLPLRLPAVLARSAASLDLLSGGRLTLALGADQENIAGLSEAIEILRGILDTSVSSPLTTVGKVYRTAGAQRGPTPVHDIPIWVEGHDPAELSLIGRDADGWWAAPLDRAGLERANATIDAAARGTGRDPREIRRVVTIRDSGQPVDVLVSELLPLVLDEGASALLLQSTDSEEIGRFARDVIPVLREAVHRELPQVQSNRPMRRAAIRVKRRDGIDYDGLPDSLAGNAVEPGDPAYARVKSTYMRGGRPGLVLRPGNTAEVIKALAYARRHPDLPLAVRSGGHGISGRSTNDGGIVIDLGRLNDIEVLDIATRRVRIEPGARWMEVAAALEPHGWALTSGDYGGVGVGGLATAGGVGFMARKHGLTIDHLRTAEVVLADGSIVRASDDENADLFWAIRGAGANFGIVTSFEFEVDEVGSVGWAQLVFDASDIAGFLERWGAAIEAAPRDLTAQMIMGRPRPGQPFLAHVLAMVDSDRPETIIAALQPLAQIAPLYDQSVIITSYASVMANAQPGDHNGQGDPLAHSALVEHLTPELARDLARMIESGASYFFQIRAVSGAVADIDPDETAYGNRSANFSIAVLGASRRVLDPRWDALRHYFNGMYLSFETDRSIERLHDAFPPRTLARLRELKSLYDRDNVFRDNFNIAPQLALR